MVPFLILKLFNFLLLPILYSSHTILDVDELSVQYGIEITNKPVILNSQPVNENTLQLSSKHGQLYSCFLPQLPQDLDQEPSSAAPATNVIDVLDKSLNGTCLTHKKGWWTYKLCHKQSITQYHAGELGDADGPTTNLGSFSSEDDWSKEEATQRKPSEIFHSHQYVNGSVCDVTQEPRKATVQYFCAIKPADSIIRIEEPATCEYIITVHSTKLCNHPLFSKKEAKKQLNLVCSPALMEHEYNKYMEKLNKKKAAEEEKKKEVLKKKIELDKKGEKGSMPDISEALKGDSSVEGKKKQLKNAVNDIASFMKGFMKVLNIKTEGTKVINDKVTDSDANLELDDAVKDLKNAWKETPDNEDEPTDLSQMEKPGSLKSLNDFTETMIKQLEKDSERMLKKSGKEREAMHKEFDRVRENTLVELSKSKNLLELLEAMKKNGRGTRSEKELNDQIKEVHAVIESLQNQVEEIDGKRHAVDELEKDTHQRLDEINKKIHNTKTAHQFAKSLENMAGEEHSEKYFNNVISSIFETDEESKGIETEKEVNSKKVVQDKVPDDDDDDDDPIDNDDENDLFDSGDDTEKKLNVKVDTPAKINSEKEDIGDKKVIEIEKSGDPENDFDTTDDAKDVSTDMKETTKKKKHHAIHSAIKNLRDEIGKLRKKMEGGLLSKKNDNGMDTEKDDSASGSETDVSGVTKTRGKKSGLESVVNLLKKEMGKLNDQIKKDKDDVSPAARAKDGSEKDSIEDTEKDAKKKMEVRVRTVDEKSFDKEFGKTIDESVREEVKEATKKMEDTVRKQLKDSGLDFGDNIKIKIITTKDKFDKFSDGKDVKLLSDDDAADFKDLLLGFLGGGKDKVAEERRQKTLEQNYNFRLDEEDEGEL